MGATERKYHESRSVWCNKRNYKERKTWWWNGIVQQAIKEKEAYKKWQKTKEEEDREVFKKKKARKEVAKAKQKATEEWARDREGRNLKNKMLKIAKQMKRERADVVGAKFVKDGGNIMV